MYGRDFEMTGVSSNAAPVTSPASLGLTMICGVNGVIREPSRVPVGLSNFLS